MLIKSFPVEDLWQVGYSAVGCMADIRAIAEKLLRDPQDQLNASGYRQLVVKAFTVRVHCMW